MNLHIIDSYKIIIPRQIESELLIYEKLNKLNFIKRSMRSYKYEWFAHSFLYRLGLFKKHTKDVDLNDDESLFRRIIYAIIYFIFSWIYKIMGVKRL